jgi:hypothetical protein
MSVFTMTTHPNQESNSTFMLETRYFWVGDIEICHPSPECWGIEGVNRLQKCENLGTYIQINRA